MNISVIVPCRNEANHIEQFLLHVMAQELSPDVQGLEVLVADGRSTDGTREKILDIAASEPRVKLIDNPALIVSTGLNRAIRAASGEIIVRMDVHTEYAPDYIKTCVQELRRTGAQNVGGPARTIAKGYMQNAIRIAYHSPFAVGGARFHDENYEGFVDTVTYGCWHRELFDEIGMFDEELVRNQDDEFNLRTIRAGGKIWQCKDIKSWYYPRDSIRDLFKQYSQYGYWKVKVIKKHRLPASVRHLVPAMFVSSVLITLALSFLHPLFLWLAIAILGSYVTATLIASLFACGVARLKYLPVMPIVFATYHFAYGYGFLRGLIDFSLAGKGRGEAFRSLSRGSTVEQRD